MTDIYLYAVEPNNDIILSNPTEARVGYVWDTTQGMAGNAKAALERLLAWDVDDLLDILTMTVNLWR